MDLRGNKGTCLDACLSYIHSFNTVHVACNGREALDVLRRTDCPIDLILTDILMPEVSGMHLMAELAANEALRSIPVIGRWICVRSQSLCRNHSHTRPIFSTVMSSDERQDTVMRAIEAGATDYLIKPVRRNELATLWQHVWRRHRTPTTTATAPAQPPATSTAMESTAFATSYQHAKHLTNSPQQSASGTADWPTTHFVSSGSRLAVPGGATWSDAAAAESVRARGMMDDPAHLAEAASPQDPRGSDESGGGGGSTSQDATRLESGALGGDGPAATTPTNVRQPLQPCRAEPGTPASLPQGLRELVEFAERQVGVACWLVVGQSCWSILLVKTVGQYYWSTHANTTGSFAAHQTGPPCGGQR